MKPRHIIQVVLLLVSIAAACRLRAQVSVDAVSAIKRDTQTYTITIAAQVEKGFHLYGSNPSLEITAPLIIVGDETIHITETKIVSPAQTISDPLFEGKKMTTYSSSFLMQCTIRIDSTVPGKLNAKFTGFAADEKGHEFLPFEKDIEVELEGGVKAGAANLLLPGVDLAKPLQNCGQEVAEKTNEERSVFGIFLLGLLGGLVALFTPCVFPMIPVTVSFFTNRSATKKQGMRNGLLYGGCILGIYLLASLPFHLLDSVKPELLNNIATSGPLNIVFFLIFFVFALSFFGLFEIRLPSWVANKADSGSGLGSFSGIFFMALTLAIVSFSCTGPILGSLLVGSVSGGAWLLTAGLAGFGVALALPFGLFAVFPQLLKGLPKSGGWLEVFKKTLAFVELALAFKFLSNADLVGHWGVLKREIFIAIWLVITLGLAIYLLDILWLIKYGRSRATKGRFILGGTACLFAFYLVPGLTNTAYANLQLLSGFPPPLSYSIYKTSKAEKLHPIINDYDAALALAKKEQKNILIDFTGWACVNCRKMEENVWSKPEVAAYINEHFVLVSLYVDDKAKLPIEQRTREMQSVGDKWAKFQSANFKQVTQPLYVVLTPGEQLVNAPVGYTPDVKQYLKWLECGNSK